MVSLYLTQEVGLGEAWLSEVLLKKLEISVFQHIVLSSRDSHVNAVLRVSKVSNGMSSDLVVPMWLGSHFPREVEVVACDEKNDDPASAVTIRPLHTKGDKVVDLKQLSSRALGKRLLPGGIFAVAIDSNENRFQVVRTNPERSGFSPLSVSAETKWELNTSVWSSYPQLPFPTPGPDEQMLRRLVEITLRTRAMGNAGGILLTGSSGTGKTSLVKAVASRLPASVYTKYINASRMVTKLQGSPFRDLAEHAKAVGKHALLVIDDAHCLSRSQSTETQADNAKLLLSLLEDPSFPSLCIVLVVSDVTILSPSLRRSHHFQRELRLKPPPLVYRQETISDLLAFGSNRGSPDSIHQIAVASGGASFRDLSRICRKISIQRICGAETNTHNLSPFQLVNNSESAGPSIKWSEVAGCEQVRECFYEWLSWRNQLRTLGAPTAVGGILLHGPTGCGKTLCVKALAFESRLPFFSVKGSELYSKYFGDSEQLVRQLFERAKTAAPAILFIDELDAIAVSRDSSTTQEGGTGGLQQRILSQLLNEMDGVGERKALSTEHLLIIGCTNQLHLIDSALMRPGRFDQLIFVGPPSHAARKELFETQAKKMPFHPELSLDELAQLVEGLTCADIVALCREAALLSLTDSSRVITKSHFIQAMKQLA